MAFATLTLGSGLEARADQRKWRMRPSDLRMQTVRCKRVDLRTGLSMEYYHAKPISKGCCPPIVFVHGSGRAGWCWAENWMGFLEKTGIESLAVSLRGTCGSPPPDGAKKVSLRQHVEDLDAFVRTIAFPLQDKAPLLVGHSMGGLTIMSYLSDPEKLAGGAAFFCSVPPSGNLAMTNRMVRERGIGVFWNIFRGFALNRMISDEKLARVLFYPTHGAESSEFIQKLMGRMEQDSQVKLDLASLRSELPANESCADGMATWLSARPQLRCLVAGAVDDYIVDRAALTELGRFVDVEPVILGPGQAHDVMLQDGWEVGAQTLLKWAMRGPDGGSRV